MKESSRYNRSIRNFLLSLEFLIDLLILSESDMGPSWEDMLLQIRIAEGKVPKGTTVFSQAWQDFKLSQISDVIERS